MPYIKSSLFLAISSANLIAKLWFIWENYVIFFKWQCKLDWWHTIAPPQLYWYQSTAGNIQYIPMTYFLKLDRKKRLFSVILNGRQTESGVPTCRIHFLVHRVLLVLWLGCACLKQFQIGALTWARPRCGSSKIPAGSPVYSKVKVRFSLRFQIPKSCISGAYWEFKSLYFDNILLSIPLELMLSKSRCGAPKSRKYYQSHIVSYTYNIFPKVGPNN